METESGRFRGAVGGFNRRDVAQYMEKMAGEHREQVEALQGQLEQVQREKEALEGELEELRAQKEDLAGQEAQTRTSLEESARSLAVVRGELQVSQGHLTLAKKELGELRAKVARLEPLAQQYEVLKDRVATVELDAHRKAQEIISQAEARAACVRHDAAEWVEGLSGSYQALRERMSAFVLRAEETGRDFEAGEEEYQALLRRVKGEQP